LWLKGFLVCGKGYFDKLSNQYGEEERELTLPTAGRHIRHISFCRRRNLEKGHIVVIV
jgi:hypothetical protein